MANATAHVQSSVTKWGDDKIRRPLVSTAQTYFPGAMIGLNASGNADKCADTAGMRFDGLNAEAVRVTQNSGESAGDRKLLVERPFRFVMTIASAAAGDEGKPLFAVDDQTVGYTSTNLVFVGWVDQFLTSTTVLVRPWWAGPPVGYLPGSGGAVTQTTSSSTAVTLNKLTGQVTTVALTTAAGAEERFTVNDNTVLATDVIALSSTYNGAGTPAFSVTNVVAGAFDIIITNLHAANAFNAAMTINFAVIKAFNA